MCVLQICCINFHRHLLECPGENLDEFREAQLLLHLVDEIKDMQVKDEILAHPLITTFATLKYHKYRFVSVVLLIYHVINDFHNI